MLSSEGQRAFFSVSIVPSVRSSSSIELRASANSSDTSNVRQNEKKNGGRNLPQRAAAGSTNSYHEKHVRRPSVELALEKGERQRTSWQQPSIGARKKRGGGTFQLTRQSLESGWPYGASKAEKCGFSFVFQSITFLL